MSIILIGNIIKKLKNLQYDIILFFNSNFNNLNSNNKEKENHKEKENNNNNNNNLNNLNNFQNNIISSDIFISDFSVGMGILFFEFGGINNFNIFLKYERLYQIYNEIIFNNNLIENEI